MADVHPDDLQLLAYVEDELAAPEREEIERHVGTCATCARTVGELTDGREALGAAPMLELPHDARERISAGLDRHRPARRRTFVSPLRLVTILAPVAVVVAVVVAVASLSDGGADDAEQQGAAVAEESAPETEAAEEGGADESRFEGDAEGGGQALSRMPVVSVAGPPSEVAAALRAEGFEARVVGRTVVVRGGNAERVASALEERPRGPVAVVLE